MLRAAAPADRRLRDIYRAALDGVPARDLARPDVTDIARIQKAPLTQVDSFWYSLLARRRKKQLGLMPEKYIGVTKDRDWEFVTSLGVAVPRVLFTGRFGDIPAHLRSSTVIKPLAAADSKGVFLAWPDGTLFSVFSSELLSGWEAMAPMLATQVGVSDPHDVDVQVQELVFEGPDRPARDFKFYTFYGEIGMFSEVSRYPTKQFAYFNPDLTVADCGREHEPRFRDPADTIADKCGLTASEVELVKRISLEIPAPFMRIDMLRGESELVFCEFSSSPGASDTLSPEYDRILGRFYHQAEVRLQNDLLRGKRFEPWRAYWQSVAPEQYAIFGDAHDGGSPATSA